MKIKIEIDTKTGRVSIDVDSPKKQTTEEYEDCGCGGFFGIDDEPTGDIQEEGKDIESQIAEIREDLGFRSPEEETIEAAIHDATVNIVRKNLENLKDTMVEKRFIDDESEEIASTVTPIVEPDEPIEDLPEPDESPFPFEVTSSGEEERVTVEYDPFMNNGTKSEPMMVEQEEGTLFEYIPQTTNEPGYTEEPEEEKGEEEEQTEQMTDIESEQAIVEFNAIVENRKAEYKYLPTDKLRKYCKRYGLPYKNSDGDDDLKTTLARYYAYRKVFGTRPPVTTVEELKAFLGSEFPDVKFKTATQKRTSGDYVLLKWTGGPTEECVKSFCDTGIVKIDCQYKRSEGKE